MRQAVDTLMRVFFVASIVLVVWVVCITPAWSQSGDAIWLSTAMKETRQEIISTIRGTLLFLGLSVGFPLWCLVVLKIREMRAA